MKTKLFSLLLTLVASVGTLFANGTQIGDLYYNLNNENQTAEVTYMDLNDNYPGLSSLEVPENVTCEGTKYIVSGIGEQAFFRCADLRDVSIPNSVTHIGTTAFSGCCRLKSIDVPNSVTSLSPGVFSGCDSLTAVTLGDGITTIEETSFAFCRKLVTIKLPNGLTNIEREAFRYCSSLKSIIIPNTVSSIGYRAFQFSGLRNVDIPDNVISIAADAFELVMNINYTGSATGSPWGAKCMNGYWESYLLYKDASMNLLMACSPDAIGEISIPQSVKGINGYAFFNCANLTNITIPESIEFIGYSAFKGCTGLTCITIPNSIKSIEEEMFYDCTNLINVTIGSGVQFIQNLVFARCESLKTIYNYSVTPQPINDKQFKGWDITGCTLYVPEQSISLYRYAEGWKHCKSIIGIKMDDVESPITDSIPHSKILKNGQLIILRDGKTYTVQGQEVR